jgi:hypothetical protein
MKLQQDIAIWEQLLTPQECHTLTQHYEMMSSMCLSFSRQQLKDNVSHKKADHSVSMLDPDCLTLTPDQALINDFLRKFWGCYEAYTEKYSLLKELGKHGIRFIKIQKTLPSEGYHLWHYESDCVERSSRICAWSVFLNTVETGGETEFLYQQLRIPATQGTLAIWPAGFTHVHRGNPPLSGEKYLLTGWLEFL